MATDCRTRNYSPYSVLQLVNDPADGSAEGRMHAHRRPIRRMCQQIAPRVGRAETVRRSVVPRARSGTAGDPAPRLSPRVPPLAFARSRVQRRRHSTSGIVPTLVASPAPVSASSLCAPSTGGCSRRAAHDPTPRTESRPAHVRYDSWAAPRRLLAMPSVSSGKWLSVDIILKVRLSSRAGLINPLPTGAMLLDTCLVIPHIHDCLWADMASMSGLWPWPDIELIGKRNTLICPVNLLCWTGL